MRKMTARVRALGAAVVLAGSLAGAAAAQPAQAARPAAACDRACLNQMLEDYLTALKAHDPSRLPLAEGVKFSENNSPLALPDGLWNAVDKISDYRLPFIDPEDGQAGLYTTVEEDGKGAILSLRLKVENRKITEIETMVLRPQANNGFGNATNIPRRPVFYEDIPEDKRLTRTQLVSIANAYFETLQQNHGVVFAPFAPTCHRIETSRNPTTGWRPSQTAERALAGRLRGVPDNG